jgi:hypothetical protein
MKRPPNPRPLTAARARALVQAKRGRAGALREGAANMATRPPRRKLTPFVTLGRLGGRSTSPAKVAASRANGAKGGRPRKEIPRVR